MSSYDTERRAPRGPGRRWLAAAAVAGVGAVALAACGGGAAHSNTTRRSTSAPSTSNIASAPVLSVMSDASLGQPVIVDASGRTVYLYLPDGTSTTSTVPAGLRANWPPVTVSTAAAAGAGLDSTQVAVLPQPDGTQQVAYHGHLLYTFVNDTAPGQANGQGLGKVWFALSPSGDPIGAPPVATPSPMPAAAIPAPAPATVTPMVHASQPAAPPAPHPPAAGNDGDADNHGGPSDGDGNK